MKDINETYYNILLEKFRKNESKSLTLHQPEKGIETNVVCLPIANKDDLKEVNIVSYESLTNVSTSLKNYDYRIIKMQAGLGSSVKRDDLIMSVEGRKTLGAKGTDLYFDINGEQKSIAEIQVMQANALAGKEIYNKIIYQNLVNEETEQAVLNATKNVQTSENCEIKEAYFQKKMSTINEAGELTDERKAPAGHGFVGICEILNTLEGDSKNEIIAIGNGEDLSSTPDELITSWMVDKNIPLVMMTTTKTKADKKGGQIAIVKEDYPIVTIVEKAQAEESDQLEYFEELGLREGDKISLFNTNVVLMNKKAFKEKLKLIDNMDVENFINDIAPDVIQNVKTQDGKKFTQLESALGSVMLNLDSYFRKHFKENLVSFLNLEEENRLKFFMPIKKREDYEEIKSQYLVDPSTYRLVLK